MYEKKDVYQTRNAIRLDKAVTTKESLTLNSFAGILYIVHILHHYCKRDYLKDRQCCILLCSSKIFGMRPRQTPPGSTTGTFYIKPVISQLLRSYQPVAVHQQSFFINDVHEPAHVQNLL